MSKHLSFIGLPGSGKSTISKEIEKKFKLHSIDTDKIVERIAEENNITKIFEKTENIFFDEFEELAVRESFLNQKICTIATGGRTVLNPINASIVKNNSIVVWLNFSTEETANRIFYRNKNRLNKQTKKECYLYVKNLIKDREHAYRNISDLIISKDEFLKDEITEIAYNFYKTMKNKIFKKEDFIY